jgi:hypothetical protein
MCIRLICFHFQEQPARALKRPRVRAPQRVLCRVDISMDAEAVSARIEQKIVWRPRLLASNVGRIDGRHPSATSLRLPEEFAGEAIPARSW